MGCFQAAPEGLKCRPIYHKKHEKRAEVCQSNNYLLLIAARDAVHTVFVGACSAGAGQRKEGAAMEDEQSAWTRFAQTGSVQDYLHYAQCKHEEETHAADTDAGAGATCSASRGE